VAEFKFICGHVAVGRQLSIFPDTLFSEHQNAKSTRCTTYQCGLSGWREPNSPGKRFIQRIPDRQRLLSSEKPHGIGCRRSLPTIRSSVLADYLQPSKSGIQL